MDIRLPKPKFAALILKKELAEEGLQVTNIRALDIVARIYGYTGWNAMQQDPNSQSDLALKAKSSTEFVLAETAIGGCRINVKNIAVSINSTEEGVDVALWATHSARTEPLAAGSATFKDAAEDYRRPNPDKPFYGCRMPQEIIAIEFVSSDARALEWSDRRQVLECHSWMLEWFDNGMKDDSADLSEVVVVYQDEGRGEISGEDLVGAELQPDGRFVLKSGQELYLIDENNRRWTPIKRA